MVADLENRVRFGRRLREARGRRRRSRYLKQALRLGKVVLQMLHCLVGALLSGAAVVAGVSGPAVVAVIGLHIDAGSVGVLRTHAGEYCQYSSLGVRATKN